MSKMSLNTLNVYIFHYDILSMRFLGHTETSFSIFSTPVHGSTIIDFFCTNWKLFESSNLVLVLKNIFLLKNILFDCSFCLIAHNFRLFILGQGGKAINELAKAREQLSHGGFRANVY